MFDSIATQLVVIQPTPFCNIDCRYCYLPDRGSTRRISDETLASIFDGLFESQFVKDNLTIVWHAGEPLTVGIEFYERAFDVINSRANGRVAVKNCFQTNATLIDDRWCDFIVSHDVDVGVSADGPQWLHDLNRVDRAGRGTFDRTRRGISLLQARNIDFQVIVVLTRAALGHADEIWDFFRALEIKRLGFNIEECEGAHARSSLQQPNIEIEFREFLQRLLKLRDESDTDVWIREIDLLIEQIERGEGEVHSTENTPFSILAFDCDGNMTTFSPELLAVEYFGSGPLTFGNIRFQSISAIASSPSFLTVSRQISNGVNECRRTCGYFSLCGGGAPSNKFCENGTFESTETMHCRLRRKVTTDVVLGYLESRYGIV